MPRGIPWDELSLTREKKDAPVLSSKPTEAELIENNDVDKPRNYYKDADQIGRRVAFGLICGSLTGLCFGTVDILRDTKAMTAKKSIATAKLMRYTGLFGGFFASYHGIRKTLMTYYPQPIENNVVLSAAICVTPLIAFPALRPLIPYSIMLIGLDAINGLD